jgi:serine/threonine protein kinase
MKMAKDITLGLNWLHSNKPAIIHRDLNPSNLLVDNNLHVKIADYGLSKFQDDDPDQMVTDSGKGTPYWMAPEILMNQSFSEKSDVYSFGIVMWQLLTRQEPFNEFDDFDTFYRAVCDENIRPFIPSDTHPSLRDLITGSCTNVHTAIPRH